MHFGLPELPVAQAQGYVGDGVVLLLRRVLGHDVERGVTGPEGLPVSDEDLARAMEVFADHYGRHLLDNTRLYPGVLDVLARYRQVPIHLATNKPRLFTDPILRGLHIDAAFDRVVCGDEAPVRKPDPSHLRACLPEAMIDFSRVAVVGDSPNDVNAARALGALAVGCTYGLGAPGQVKAAGPDFLIDAVGDLNFENSDNLTFLLVTDFTGSAGDDIDVAEDGVIDNVLWTAIIDDVAFVENTDVPTFGEYYYSANVVGPDGTYVLRTPGRGKRRLAAQAEFTRRARSEAGLEPPASRMTGS